MRRGSPCGTVDVRAGGKPTPLIQKSRCNSAGRGGTTGSLLSPDMPSPTLTKPRERSYAPWLTLFILVGLAAYLLWRGHGYYSASLDARFDHPEGRELRAAGTIGHGYGIVGTVLILTNLLYLVRRRFSRFSFGSLKRWLDVHVIAGLAGALLVAFHSTFELRTQSPRRRP